MIQLNENPKFPMPALALAAKTADAYSASLWGCVQWVKAADMLLKIGIDETRAEHVLRSKWMRWTRDAYPENPEIWLPTLAHNVRSASDEEWKSIAL